MESVRALLDAVCAWALGARWQDSDAEERRIAAIVTTIIMMATPLSLGFTVLYIQVGALVPAIGTALVVLLNGLALPLVACAAWISSMPSSA